MNTEEWFSTAKPIFANIAVLFISQFTNWREKKKTRKQESKETRKQELDQESDQEKNKVFSFFLG